MKIGFTHLVRLKAGNKFYSTAKKHRETTRLYLTGVVSLAGFGKEGGLARKSKTTGMLADERKKESEVTKRERGEQRPDTDTSEDPECWRC